MYLPVEIINYEFDTRDLVCLFISTVVGVWYVMKKVYTHTHTHMYTSSLLLYFIKCVQTSPTRPQ